MNTVEDAKDMNMGEHGVMGPTEIPGNTDADGLGESTHSQSSTSKKKKEAKPMASFSETMGFVWNCGPKVQLLLVIGSIAGVANGLVYPILAYLFSSAFSDISSAENQGLKQVRELAFTFMVVGSYALVAATIQGWCFETCAYYGSQAFRLQWFQALLRQDPAYFDVRDVGGIAAQIGPNSIKFRRGVGRKFGEGIQFFITGVGGLGYAFFASWRVALVILAIIPFVAVAAMSTVTLNQTKGKRAAESYKAAGSVAYSTVSAIRTVLSLNAVEDMIERYKVATTQAFEVATQILIKIGLANGKSAFCRNPSMRNPFCFHQIAHTRFSFL